MKYRILMTGAGVAAITIGFAFLGYGPMMAPLFGAGEIPKPEGEWLHLWRLYSFVRVFGAVLFGMGIISLLGISITDPAAQKHTTLGHFFAYLMACTIALTQQIALWDNTAGWLLCGYFFVFAWAFGYVGFIALSDAAKWRQPGFNGNPEVLKEQWRQQIEASAVQQERNRLARDLHDSIKQQIFTINVSAATAQTRWESDPAAAHTALNDVRNSAHEAMVEMEAMLQHLRPTPLETVGLVDALRKQCEALQYRTGAVVTTEFTELPENDRIRPGAQGAVFWVAQEALANIARHARAKNVTVKLSADGTNQSFVLQVQDDGQGYAPKEVKEGMGTTNMRERALEISGYLNIWSSPGEGTKLTLSIPLSKAAERVAGHHLFIGSIYLFISALFLYLVIIANWDNKTNILLAIPFAMPIIMLAIARFDRMRRVIRSSPKIMNWAHILKGAF
jgi:signal transduction histidine kinase